MSYLGILFFFSISSFSFGSSNLIGTWSFCDQDHDGLHYEHVIDFGENGKEVELHIVRARSKIPCEGAFITNISREWRYESKNGTFQSVLGHTDVIAYNEKVIKEFNRMNICNSKKWKKGTWINCTLNLLTGFEERPGYKNSHSYTRHGDELVIVDKDGDATIYKKVSSPNSKR